MITTHDCSEAERLDPRVRRTRKLIEDAFRALLAERPYAEIAVADIAARATVNRGTFYAHYEDKEHLATTMMREDLSAVLRTRLAHDMPLTPETFGGMAELAFEFFGRVVAGCRQRDREFAPTLMATLQQTIQDIVRKWLDLDPNAMDGFRGGSKDEVATVLAWGLYGAALRWSRLSRRPPAAEAARRIATLLLR
jgi:AcrR family transcriptional regulator